MNPYVIPGLLRSFNNMSVEDIVNSVCKTLNIKKEKIYTPNRKRPVVTARQLCMWILRKKMKLPLKTIATEFQMDHTTVIHGVRMIEEQMAVYDHFKLKVKEVIYNITNMGAIKSLAPERQYYE
jgi:chromosomal replication initiator protein